ncbi:MAG: glycerate kinase [Bacteroidaceae bacterium]|nr:glycerate kinase [Bacteroidaceae bacterium]
MRVIIAMDSFKGCLSSKEAGREAAKGVREAWPEAEVEQTAVSDGGEGFVDAYHAAIGGERVEVEVRDPLMRPIKACYLLQETLAVVEMAQASGLTLLAEHERNPLRASSYGTGQLIAHAVRQGARHIIVGLGGSATSDAGQGMLRALIDSFAPRGDWDDIKELRAVRFTMASDVRNPLCGPQGAAHVFGAQKGATAEMMEQLDARARRFAQEAAARFGFDRSQDEGAGAAGGLGYALLQYLNAESRSGIDLLLEAAAFDRMAREADLIITGEGSADRQTLMGKLPMGILHHAQGIPVCLIAGQVTDRNLLLQAGFTRVECINPPGIPLVEAMHPEVARHHISQTVRDMLRAGI